MAYTLDYEDDEQQQNKDATGQPVDIAGGGPSTATAATAGNPNAAAGSATGPAKGSVQGSGQFQNLDDYVTANEGKGFGTQLADKVQGTVNDAASAAAGVGTQFKAQSDQATTAYDPSQASAILDRAGTDAAQDSDLADWNKYYNATYNGPTAVSGALGSKLQGTAQQAADQSAATASEPGRFALLDTYFGRPQYSQGEKSLDSFLVDSDQSAQPQLQDLQKQGQAALANSKTEAQQLQDYAAQNAATTTNTNAAARAALGVDAAGNPITTDASGNTIAGTGALGAAEQAAADTFNSRQTSDTQEASDLQNAFATGDYSQLTPEERALFGNVDLTSLYGVNPAGLLSQTSGLTQATTATPQEIARMKALDILAGVNPTWAADPEAGSANGVSSFAFDAPTLQSNVQAAQAQYNDQLAKPTQFHDPLVGDSSNHNVGYVQSILNSLPGSDRDKVNATVNQPRNAQQQISFLQGLLNQIPQAQANGSSPAKYWDSARAAIQSEITYQQSQLDALNQQFHVTPTNGAVKPVLTPPSTSGGTMTKGK